MQRRATMETEHLPEEVILEILLRLPVKSLLRFRCVSKSWLSLISNPHFAESHFERSSQHTHRILCTYASDLEAGSLDFNGSLHDDSALVRLDFPLLKLPDDFKFMGSCRGFLLLADSDDFEVFVWNPSTGIRKQIPPPLASIPLSLYGFGYDANTDDYLIVEVFFLGEVTELQIFSLRANSWKKLEIGNAPYSDSICLPDPMNGALLNGAIHWLALRHETEAAHAAIIAFDLSLTEKNLREVPLPVCFGFGPFDECDLKAFGGCLSLIGMIGRQIEIWIMREYGVESSWTKHITVSPSEISIKSFSPICFTKDGHVVGIDGFEGFIKCNDKGELLEYREYGDDLQGFLVSASVYTESLLSLPTDHGEKAEDRQW